MNLLIDAGSSRLKWAYQQGDDWQYGKALAYDDLDLSRLWQRDIEQVGLVSVRPDWTDRLLDYFEQRGLNPHLLRAQAQWHGLRCGYRQPQQLGADRWAALIAVHAMGLPGACIVDCGTACTLDFIQGDQHLGGYILPGLGLMRSCLLKATAIQLNYAPQDEDWGRDTASGIELGRLNALLALIESSLEKLQARGICDPELILTGGDAAQLFKKIQISAQLKPHLVLEGLTFYLQDSL